MADKALFDEKKKDQLLQEWHDALVREGFEDQRFCKADRALDHFISQSIRLRVGEVLSGVKKIMYESKMIKETRDALNEEIDRIRAEYGIEKKEE